MADPCNIDSGNPASCQNTEGSFTCTCDQGYEFGENQPDCMNINECDLVDFDACSISAGNAATCEDTDGSYSWGSSYRFNTDFIFHILP